MQHLCCKNIPVEVQMSICLKVLDYVHVKKQNKSLKVQILKVGRSCDSLLDFLSFFHKKIDFQSQMSSPWFEFTYLVLC